MGLDNQINLIERFLHLTSEPYEDWDWDGQELVIFSGKNVEKYSLKDLKEIIKGFK